MSEFLNAPQQDVALFSRIRLARNFEDIPFSPQMDSAQAELLIDRAEAALDNGGQRDAFRMERMNLLSENERGELLEHFQISNDLLKYADRAAALLSQGATISIMMGEEDHLRIFGMMHGLQLERAADLAYTAETWLEKGSAFAFDTQFGYLTASPTNAGTGMRASIVLHLPILRATGQIGKVVQEVAKSGLTLRGLYNDGNEADGHLYHLSNHFSLGRAEEDILRSVITSATQLIHVERSVRENMLSQDKLLIMDRLYRSIGILRSARLMNDKEWLQRWSDLRLSAVLGLVDVSLVQVDQMLMDLQPYSLNIFAEKQLSERERSEVRADRLRKIMTSISDMLTEI